MHGETRGELDRPRLDVDMKKGDPEDQGKQLTLTVAMSKAAYDWCVRRIEEGLGMTFVFLTA
jgi:hypothetical protein